MSGIKDMLFALMEQDHQRALQLDTKEQVLARWQREAKAELAQEEEEFVSVEDARHERSAERAGEEALNYLGR